MQGAWENYFLAKNFDKFTPVIGYFKRVLFENFVEVAVNSVL